MSEGKLSFFATTVTLSRLCLGPGILAIPSAFVMGGLGFSPIGIIVIAAWNGLSCLMMINCRLALHSMKTDKSWKEPAGILLVSTYSEVAYAGLGKFGLYLADFCVAGSLLGVCCASQINFATLLHDLPSINLSVSTLTVISAVICYPIACARDLSALSSMQFIGLLCLLLNVAAVLAYGYLLYADIPPESIESSLTLLPSSEVELSSYIGIACFCFGVCTYIFPVEESMENTKDFGLALLYCLVLVSGFYIFVGEAAAVLFSATTQGHVSGNILLNLPSSSFTTLVARISMACICILTYPLVLLPPSTMIENTISHTDITERKPITHSTALMRSKSNSKQTMSRHQSYSDVDLAMSESSKRSANTSDPVSWPVKALIRLALCILTTVFAAYVPCFGSFISLIGCFTISILSFLLPPLLHLSLVTLPALTRLQAASTSVPLPPSLAVSRNGYQQIGTEDTEEGFSDCSEQHEAEDGEQGFTDSCEDFYTLSQPAKSGQPSANSNGDLSSALGPVPTTTSSKTFIQPPDTYLPPWIQLIADLIVILLGLFISVLGTVITFANIASSKQC